MEFLSSLGGSCGIVCISWPKNCWRITSIPSTGIGHNNTGGRRRAAVFNFFWE